MWMDVTSESWRSDVGDFMHEILAGKSHPNMGLMPTEASGRMSRQRRRDTEPEMLLRRELHRRGLRYRVDAKLPGMPRRRADVLFPRRQVAVFIDGCFWHACPVHGRQPKANPAYWGPKLQANVERDERVTAALRAGGWEVLRFWEHQDPAEVCTQVLTWVKARQ